MAWDCPHWTLTQEVPVHHVVAPVATNFGGNHQKNDAGAGRHYCSGFPGLLRDELDERLRFSGRNRRPPRGRIKRQCLQLQAACKYLSRTFADCIHTSGSELLQTSRCGAFGLLGSPGDTNLRKSGGLGYGTASALEEETR